MAKNKYEYKPEPKAEEKTGAAKAIENTGTADLQGKDIDERMADLLKEHQDMGARPK